MLRVQQLPQPRRALATGIELCQFSGFFGVDLRKLQLGRERIGVDWKTLTEVGDARRFSLDELDGEIAAL